MITVIGSLKGGSGKSTVTFNLAIWLQLAGENVRVFDLDPQATLTDAAEVRSEEGYQPAIPVFPIERVDDLNAESGETLVDVGAADMDSMMDAIAMADRVLVPVPPSQADIWSTQRFLGMISKRVNGSPGPDVLAFINRGDTHSAIRESDEAAAALISLNKVHFVRNRLGQRTAYRRSFSEGLAVFELDPRGKAAREFTALAAALYPHLLRTQH
ncbi:MAG: AAA family ATPase [Chromatiales bacterium]|nr:AAA family ATPase [Chromatiales bacterium]